MSSLSLKIIAERGRGVSITATALSCIKEPHCLPKQPLLNLLPGDSTTNEYQSGRSYLAERVMGMEI
jgi:hypothetical protein